MLKPVSVGTKRFCVVNCCCSPDPASRLRPMSIDDPAYPFLALAGIPSISFHFISSNVSLWIFTDSMCCTWVVLSPVAVGHTCELHPHLPLCVCVCLQAETYKYYGTSLDTKDHLNFATNQKTGDMTVLAAQFAGQMALQLVHDHVISLDVTRYKSVLSGALQPVFKRVMQLSQVGLPAWISVPQLFYFDSQEDEPEYICLQ